MTSKLITSFKVLAYAVPFVLTSLLTSSDALAQTINIGPNQYAFRFTQNPNYGLFFNAANVRYEFRNGAAAPIFAFNADNGNMNTNLQFATGSNYLVSPGTFAARSATAPNAGLFFGNTDFEFRTVGGAAGISMNATTGNTVIGGTLAAAGGNSTQWNQAHSWGNHATAGYISSEADPKISGSLETSDVPRWNGTQLASSALKAGATSATISGAPSSLSVGGIGGSMLTLSNPGSSNILFTSEVRMSFVKADVSKGSVRTSGDNFVVEATTPGSLILRNGSADRLTINSTGNVGIGAAPATGVRLAVNGQVLATSMKVQAVANWPDYVFGESYDLMSIEQLEEFVNVHKHLPGIPSANDVEVNDGFELGDMQKRTLEKVEELTLYLIEQNKLVKAQQATMEMQQKQIEMLMQAIR